MNWKLVGALLVGAGLLTACGAAQNTPQSSDTRTPVSEEAGTSADVQQTAPGTQPAAAPGAPSPEPAAKKDSIVVHD